jgi:uncharacterized membrane protein (DUF106 family)
MPNIGGAIAGFFLNLFIRAAIALGLYKAIVDKEKIKRLEAEVEHANKQAEKWANRPVGNPNTVARLRKHAERAKRNNP